MAISKTDLEIEVNVPAREFWENMRNNAILFPKIFHQHIKSMEVVEGDGKGAGTVLLVKYQEGFPGATFLKEHYDMIDEEDKKMQFSLVGGEVLSIYKSFKITYHVIPKDGSGSCLVKYTLEYQKNDEVAEEVASKTIELVKHQIVGTCKGLEKYLNSTVEVEVELKVSADKFWEAMKNNVSLFPKIFHEQIKSAEVVDGDGRSAGTVLLVKYNEGFPIATFVKEKFEVVDEKKRLTTFSFIGGEILDFYKTFSVTYHVTTPKEEGCLVKWTLQHEKKEGVLEEELAKVLGFVKHQVIGTCKGLELYLLSSST